MMPAAPNVIDNRCVEHGVWTPIPFPAPTSLDAFTLHLKDVDAAEHTRIAQASRMTFQLVGCSGDAEDHRPQQLVAAGMVEQIQDPSAGRGRESVGAAASFLYHLGDVTYTPDSTSDLTSDTPDQDQTVEPGEDRGVLYNDQFYAPYSTYDRPIVAIAGNHDGKDSPHPRKSAIGHFFTNFCASTSNPSPDNETDSRGAMTQPYIYWHLNTPLAHILGLYSNIANGGILDDPTGPEDGPQYRWLVAQLRALRVKEEGEAPRKALVLAVHYPPYSGASNFLQRGKPQLGPTKAERARPLGAVLQRAFDESGQRPDLIVSAHAHLYQRLTYRYADGWELPCLVVGSGGHAPVERLFESCDGSMGSSKDVPFDAVLPSDFSLPAGDTAEVVAYDDQSFGFLHLTVGSERVAGEFFAATPQALTCVDSFNLDMTTHLILRG